MESLAYIYIAQAYEEATLKYQQVYKLVHTVETNVNKTEVKLLRTYADLKK
ncbi:hypothetical protein Cri9333_1808 [Crinalium epipsammum PCC 9333]|uniref:Uncharacterized protein n=1 Tax=Crinalium epipsammum PCC 9333 TaxID=1173022 RepID=K9VX55_9CYAN|nr:hypothetical protein [Crinalium epipsammum]AFZ12693.1 hypothetical protein Cri9333_1808 [Crinalium epipsammum PCC 9333]